MSFSNANVFVILLYVIPGFIAIEVYRLRYPGKRISDAQMIVRSLIWSFAIHVFLGSMSVVTDDPRINYVTRPLQTVGFKSVVLLIGCGCLLGAVLIVQHAIRGRLRLLPPDPLSVWPKVNFQRKQNYWAAVILKDSSRIYLGWISDFTFDPNDQNQDFLLSEAKRVDENLNVLYEVAGPGVYLKTSDVLCIEYLDAQQTEQEAPSAPTQVSDAPERLATAIIRFPFVARTIASLMSRPESPQP